MALPHLITEKERDWLFKVTKSRSPWPERDLCLLAFFIGSPCTILELNKIMVSDVIDNNGDVNKSFIIRGDKDFNGEDRKMFINQKIKKLIDSYLYSIGGLHGYNALFRTLYGPEFALTEVKGRYRADSLTRHILNLLRESGIESPSALSGRRTFATTANRNGIHISVIHHLLGNKAIKTTKRLINSDPLTMGEVSSNAY